jgi:hypothetical protein
MPANDEHLFHQILVDYQPLAQHHVRPTRVGRPRKHPPARLTRPPLATVASDHACLISSG